MADGMEKRVEHVARYHCHEHDADNRQDPLHQSVSSRGTAGVINAGRQCRFGLPTDQKVTARNLRPRTGQVSDCIPGTP